MSTIQFDNGREVEFDGDPTPEDVEYVAQSLGIGSQDPKKQSFMEAMTAPKTPTKKPQLSPESVDVTKVYEGLKDVIKATPDIAENVFDTFTTKKGLSDTWKVLKGAGLPSVSNVMTNFNDLFWGGAEKGFKSVGLDTFSEWAGNDKAMSRASAKKSSDEIKKFFYGDGDVLGYSDPNDTRSFLEKISAEDGEKEISKVVGQQIPTFLALLGVTIGAKGANLPALPATLSASFAMNSGDAYQQGKDYIESTGEPMTPELESQIQKASVIAGAMTAPLDAFGMDRILKPSQFINFKSKLVGATINGILDTGVDAVAEGGTEAVQEIIQNAWAKTYNENQDIFAGVGEAFFGGGLFGGGSSALINSGGLLRTGVLERMKQGEDKEKIKADVIEGAKQSGAKVTDAQIDDAIADAETVYNGVVDDVISKLDEGKSTQEVAMEVAQNTDIDNAIEFVNRVAETQTKTVEDTTQELNALSDKVDASVLKKTAVDLQNDFERVQAHIDEQVKSIKEEVDTLKQQVDNAPDKSTEKKRLKITLENKRGELRDAEASFTDKVIANAKAFRTFVTDYAMENGATKEQASQIADVTSDIVTSENAGQRTVEDIVAEQLNTAPKAEIKPVSTKNRQKGAKNDEKVSKVVSEKKAPVVESKVKKEEKVTKEAPVSDKRKQAEEKLGKIEDKMNVEDPMSKAFHLGKGGFAKGNNVSKAKAENERNITKTVKQAKEHVAVVKELEDIAIVEKNYKKLTDQYQEALTLQKNKETSKGVKLSEGELRELKKMIREYEVRMGRLERSHGFVRPEVTFATDIDVATKDDYTKGMSNLQKSNVDRVLGTKIRLDGKVMTKKESVEKFISEGYIPKTFETNKIKDPSRTQFNRMNQQEQDAFERKQKEAGKKIEYTLYNDGKSFDVTKIEYDYATSLVNKEIAKDTNVPTTETDPIKRNTAIVIKLQEGTATLEEYNAGYKDFIENKDAIKAQLLTQKKDELMKRVGRFSYSIRPSSSKNDMVNSILDTMESRFALGKNIVYSFGGRGSSGAVSDLVEKMTQEDLTKYAEKVKENTKAYADSIQAHKKALTNPETLEEFQTYLQANNGDTTKLTPEQLKNYDELLALAGKAKREKATEEKGRVRGVDAGTDLIVTETKNTKTGEDIFVVKLSDRVEKETYQALNASAKKLGGYYSRFSKGFLFKDRASAEQFVQVGNGKEVKTDAPVIRAENKKNATAQKLADMAISMREKANEELNRERQTNTSRRAGMASSAEESARVDLAMADTMENLSKAIESREAVLLDGITARTQIEALESILRRAHYENSRKIEGYGKQEEFRKQAPTEEDIPFVSKFPDPVGMVGLREAVQKGLKTSGSIKLAKTIQKAIEKLPADTNVFPASMKGMDTIAELVDNLNLDSYSSLRHEVATFKRLKAMGVTGTAELRAILREFLTYRGTKQEANKAVELERKLIGAKVGVDFFPTPKALAERMVSDAGVEAGMKVLEPSAGNGNIAEVMKDNGANVDVLEISSELRNILTEKGFNVVGNDFMDYTEGGYDAIVMNPPFSSNQDMKHIKHAYTLLKDGGKLSAIAGEGAFLRNNATSQEFKDWLDEVGADVEQLPANTFTDKKLMVNTGANARLITITKEATDPSSTEEGEAYRQAFENSKYYFENDERPQIVNYISKTGDQVAYRTSTSMAGFPDHLKERALFNSVKPYWYSQERPTRGSKMQEPYDYLVKDTKDTADKMLEANKTVRPQNDSDIPFKIRKFKFDTDYSVRDATNYLNDLKSRLGIDFDVNFVDSILVDYKVDPLKKTKEKRFAYGVYLDNTIAIANDIASYTAEHESVHLTLANMYRIQAFKNEGLSKDKVMQAMANQMGVVLSDKTKLDVEEQIAYDFELYTHDKKAWADEIAKRTGEKPSSILAKFYEVLKKLIMQFAEAISLTQGDVIKNYYEILADGVENNKQMLKFQNNGLIKSYIEDGELSIYTLEKEKNEALSKFKLREENDAYLQKTKKTFNELVDKSQKLVADTEAWKADIDKKLIEKAKTAEIVDETRADVKEASRFTTRNKPPVGSLTKRGEEIVTTLDFKNKDEAQKEISDYLLIKTQLVQTVKQLRALSLQISNAKKEGKATRKELRDVARRLKLRKKLLEQKEFYVNMGKGQGKKEAFTMIQKRNRVIRDTQELFGISDAKAKELIGSKRINQMSEKQFNEFLTWFTNNAQLQQSMMSAREEVQAILFEKQFQKEDNLRKALGLPPLNQMTEAQATMYAGVLYTYQFGDVFLTKREMETSARTKYEDIRTERELIQKIEEVAGIPRGELKTIDATSSDRYKNWYQLSKKNLFYKWLVDRKMIAKTKEIKQVYDFRRQLDSLTRKARKSRSGKKSLKDNIWDFVAPTDAEVFEALNTGDFSKLTIEEKALADFLTIMFRAKYENLASNFKDFKGRENYVTHMSRDFFETLRDTGSVKEAINIFREEQKDTENALEILAGQTGQILAFDKFLPYMLKRSDKIVPSKNVSRIALTYFTATTRKELLDEFIPEAMLTLHGYKVLTGQTAKGLDMKPFLETFTKEYLNDAKGRKIDYITRQGSDWDTGLMAFTGWISFKYIGGNPILAFMNLFGDLVALSAGTTNKEKALAVARIFRKNNAEEVIRGLIGHNPLTDLLNTQTGFVQRILPVWFSMMSSTSYLANKFTAKGLLTEEEFRTGIVSDERIQDMARQINKFKLTDSYGRSLVGNTSAGKASLQFKTWAVPFLITATEHMKSVVTVMKERGFNPETKKDAIELARIVIIGGIMYAVVQVISNAFGGDDDKDNYLWKQIENNLNTIYGLLSMNILEAPVIVGEVGRMHDLLMQVATMEKYSKPTAKGAYAGDLKAMETLKQIITPAGATRIFKIKKEDRSPSEVLIDESLKTGEFDAESIAMMTSMNWGEKTESQREAIINRITQEHTVKTKYPDSKVADIILGEKNNKDRVTKLLQYSEKVGIEATYTEMKTLMKDKELYLNQKKYTGAFISAELFRDFQLARKKLQTNK